MPGNFLRIVSLVLACVAAIVSSDSAADRPAVQELREETWALMTPLPMFAYVVRPVGGGPYPLLIGWSPAKGGNDDDATKSSAKNISRNIFSDFCRARARPRSQPSRVERLVRQARVRQGIVLLGRRRHRIERCRLGIKGRPLPRPSWRRMGSMFQMMP